MRIVVDGNELRLADPGVFTAFDVLTTHTSAAEVLAALGEQGAPCSEPDHVFLSMATVRVLAGAAANDAWEQQFQGMCAYAASNGWLNDSGDMIKAHLTRA